MQENAKMEEKEKVEGLREGKGGGVEGLRNEGFKALGLYGM